MIYLALGTPTRTLFYTQKLRPKKGKNFSDTSEMCQKRIFQILASKHTKDIHEKQLTVFDLHLIFYTNILGICMCISPSEINFQG